MASPPAPAGLRFRVAPLADGLHEETLAPAATDLDLDPAVFSDITVHARLDVRGPQVAAGQRRIHLRLVARATARLECDRTLEMYDDPVEGTHEVLLVGAGEALAEGADGEDVQVMAPDATHVDLAEPVRDTLLLALPLRRISPAARDLDLPTAFGQVAGDEGQPTDDRWDALRALRDDDPDASGDGHSS